MFGKVEKLSTVLNYVRKSVKRGEREKESKRRKKGDRTATSA